MILSRLLQNGLVTIGHFCLTLDFQFAAIILFTFVYTALVFNPDELADNIKKSGGFIPGIRPGKKTAEFFNYILTRLGLVGALYLAILSNYSYDSFEYDMYLNMPFYLSGTGYVDCCRGSS